ncbi:hypothetical protein P3X46_028054 [Hevea brasiliensis]|uniref:Cation/H+ exchanger domain-containing protein n=1 Tax=Hevea brasiliensis TaxID=3981 RepID=A0ABQ9KMT2_HEVBR|nr:cation/H(+) antiporter 24 [Hevea brasiliensis]KAJ9145705.1 hypothetical protein P3X46_028054 [Hevea brasiliensis]
MEAKPRASLHVEQVISPVRLICQKIHAPHPLGVFYGENPLDYSFSLVLFEIILIVLISRVVRFILKPLKQPRIVSDILGGIIIGPSVLGQSPSFTRIVFPENSVFLVQNVGIMGFMYFLFLAGVKMDLTLIRKSGKKHVYIAMIGMIVPAVFVAIVGVILRSSLDKELARVSGIGAVATDLAFTSFPVIYLVLKELNLLSSEVGRMALAVAVIGDSLGIFVIIAFEAMKQGEVSTQGAAWYFISTAVIGAFYVLPVRRVMVWIVKKTPEGKPAEQAFVILILLGVLVMGFFTDMFGLAIANGSLWFGLVVPDGPPLGATIVERSETIVMEILMPFAFAFTGLCTNVFSMPTFGWSRLLPLFIMFITGYISKIGSILASSLYFNIPLKDSLALSLILNLRGQLEILIYIHWIDKRIIGIPMFTMVVILTLLVTAISAPFVSILYNPTRPYMINRRRTIQHNPPGKELRTVVCIYDEENVAGIIDLLEVSYPTITSPFTIYALHLVELVGRATPLFIDHEESDEPLKKNTEQETIYNALKIYQEARRDFVKLHFFTALAIKRTMYQDICELALSNKASLIILPFEKGRLDTLPGTEIVRHGHGIKSISSNVIAHAPCSVGILIDKGHVHNPFMLHPLGQSTYHNYVMLFLGGADAREALSYADRMIMNPEVSLIVVRFLAYNNEGDDEIEKKLDDGVVTSFWVKNERNERVIYREIVVKNGEETLAAIQAFNTSATDLWIVGRKQGINPVILQGLSNWSENHELGTIGDIVASHDFGSTASVLVIHQQIMRGQGMATSEA